MRHPFADRIDLAGVLEARNVARRIGGRGVGPHALKEVGAIHRRGSHPHPRFAALGRRRGDVAKLQDLRTAGLGDDDGAHGTSSLNPRHPCMPTRSTASSVTCVERPVVRQFQERFTREIAAHVRGGGHAIVWQSPKRAHLVFPAPRKDDDHDLALWSLLDLGKSRWTRIEKGALRGFGTALVPRDCHEIVRHRAERDSIHEGPLRTIELDCLECGACCKDNEVILYDVDLERFKKGGRPDLARPPYARRRDGKLMLTLLRSKDCRQLLPDNKCAIYALRPDACSTFPVGSEPCLFSREEELGITDGATAAV